MISVKDGKILGSRRTKQCAFAQNFKNVEYLEVDRRGLALRVCGKAQF